MQRHPGSPLTKWRRVQSHLSCASTVTNGWMQDLHILYGSYAHLCSLKPTRSFRTRNWAYTWCQTGFVPGLLANGRSNKAQLILVRLCRDYRGWWHAGRIERSDLYEHTAFGTFSFWPWLLRCPVTACSLVAYMTLNMNALFNLVSLPSPLCIRGRRLLTWSSPNSSLTSAAMEQKRRGS